EDAGIRAALACGGVLRSIVEREIKSSGDASLVEDRTAELRGQEIREFPKIRLEPGNTSAAAASLDDQSRSAGGEHGETILAFLLFHCRDRVLVPSLGGSRL